MIKNILILALVALTGISCSKKKAEEITDVGATTGDTAKDSAITNEKMSFDATGSDGGQIAGLYTVNFDYDKATLSDDAKKRLADNAKWMKSNPTVFMQIEGHCDERGSIEYNLALGERRAKSAKAYLASLGVENKRLSVISYGKEKPIATGDTEAAMAQNRRANFVPLTK
jgi:peptidoglycan-associated lipoprotein